MRTHKTLGMVTDAMAQMGILGLLLAMVGLYGLMTYSVSLRQREMEIAWRLEPSPTPWSQ